MKLRELDENICNTPTSERIAPQITDLIATLAVELNTPQFTPAQHSKIQLQQLLNRYIGWGIVSRPVLSLAITLANFFLLYRGGKNKLVVLGYLNEQLDYANYRLAGRYLLADVEKEIKQDIKEAKSLRRD